MPPRLHRPPLPSRPPPRARSNTFVRFSEYCRWGNRRGTIAPFVAPLPSVARSQYNLGVPPAPKIANIMNIDFKLPELGENVHSGDVVNVLVAEGDTIAANDGIIELETDKAVVEIPCPHAGRVAKLLVKKGDTVKVGQTIITVASGETAEPAAAAPAASTAAAAPAAEAKSDRYGRGRQTGGDPNRGGRARSPRPHSCRPGGAAFGARTRPRPANGCRQRQIRTHHCRRSPGGCPQCDCACCAAFAGTCTGRTLASASPPPVPTGESGSDAWGPVRIEKLSRIRRTIAEQMVRAASTIPHVTNFDDADVTELERLRQGVPAGGVPLGRARISSSR